ncbi:NucA/NucB deoxyribonuclease domain-containing protein [Streptomyces sp. NPDC004111]|uniref:NucA/NucB deoxyribonuclease domain-containing protein n=1 Tax=Streptomyces sp. NPDC004111 TaxID=3364690 RepID=UPI0036A7632C
MRRFDLCVVNRVTVTAFDNKKPVGNATFTIGRHMTLQPKSLKWAETVSVSKAVIVGKAGGVAVALAVAPAKGVKASSTFPKGRKLGASAFSGRINYTAAVTKGKKLSSTVTYHWTFTKPGYSFSKLKLSSFAFRCDDTFYSRPNPARRTLSPGCAWTQAPAILDMSGLREIAAGIRQVQARGQHYERIGSPRPLHRQDDPVKQTDNRNAVCPRNAVPPAPGLSCDEYPFASTKEGGLRLAKEDRGTRWVPASEQNQQGGKLTTFYKQYRVLVNDPFFVRA